MFGFKTNNTISPLLHFLRTAILCLICFTVFLCRSLPVQAANKAQKGSNKGDSIKISNMASGYVLPVGKSVKMKVKRPSSIGKDSLLFRSSKPEIAKVSRTGKITAIKKGVTAITVYNKKNKKQKASIKLYVGKRIKSLKLTYPRGTVSLAAGQTCKVKWKVLPLGAAFKKLTWKSSAENVCKVSSKGKLTALKSGTATIKAKARDGSGKTIKFRVKVTSGKAKASDARAVTGASSSDSASSSDTSAITSIKISSPLDYPYMKVNSQITLSAEVQPVKSAGALKWFSSNSAVAAVDANGLVTARGTGTAVIYAVSGNSLARDTYTIRVPSRKDCNVTFIAHRGYSAAAPENTRAAFRLAAENSSFDAIECDVYRTRDGQYVISHDETLERLFGKDLKISEYDYADIKDLVATGGKGVAQYPNETICTLEDYLSILQKSNKRAVIELKEAFGQENSDQLYEMISAYNMNQRMDIISFKYDALDQMSQSIRNSSQTARPDLYLLSVWPDLGSGSGSSDTQYAIQKGYNLSGNYTFTDETTVAAIHNAGKKIGVWTVDDFATACHFIFDLHVNCLTSNKALF